MLQTGLLWVLDGVVRLLYTAYWMLPILAGGAVVGMLTTSPLWALVWPWALAITFVVAYIKSGRRRQDGNPHRKYPGIRGWVNARIDGLFAWIGTLKYFTSPWSVVEDPSSYKIKGDEVRQLIDNILQPGDILLRGYDGYLDGVLIGNTGDSTGIGKYFSHAALYIGDVDDVHDRPLVARRLQTTDDDGVWCEATEAQKEAIRNSPAYYQPGRQKVLHSMTRGVFAEDILTFLRCDYLAVLRLADDSIKYDAEDMENAGKTMLIPDLAGETRTIHDRLMNGETVSKADIITALRHSALGKIGSCYDFQFNAIKSAHIFSCSEFVYYCYKSIHCYLGLLPVKHAFMKYFFARETITPSDIYQVATSNKPSRLDVVWTSASLHPHITGAAQ
jgi:hypothetical protein